MMTNRSIMLIALAVAPLFAAARAQTPSRSVSAQPPSDSAAVHARLLFAIADFHVEWRRAWLLSERTRHTMNDSLQMTLRSPYVHCHNELASNSISATKLRLQGVRNLMPINARNSIPEFVVARDTTFALIDSKETAFAVCPTWLMHKIDLGREEAVVRDSALIPLVREYIRIRREKLLGILHEAARLRPADGFISGQRVRFQVDQGNRDLALDVARTCRAAAWWCAALEGYALGKQGATLDADSAFARMRSKMDAAQRCRWDDMSVLLLDDERREYQKADCAARDSINTRYWWLSDPLFRHAGNPRRVEQEMRRVDVVMRQSTGHDERYAWYTQRGGDALPILLERYGWPSYAGWGGAQLDVGHTGWLEIQDSPSAEPYTTFEYSLGRVHTLPTWSAVASPFESVAADWHLASEDVAGDPTTAWWPIEHYKPAKRLVQLEEGQTAFFRRQTSVQMATALRIAHQSMAAEASFDVIALMSPSPSRVDSIAQAIVRGGRKVVLEGVVDTVPALLSVEASSRMLDGRNRYGVVPPRTLASMQRGEIGLSDPVLLERGDTDLSALATGNVLEAMLPASNLGSDQRSLRVFWESYGINSGDTVTVAVRVTSDLTVGRLRRIGIALNVATDPVNSVEVRWNEPNAQHAIHTLIGPVTVQMRVLALNLAQLAPGPYVLEIGMQKGNGPMVRSQRRFSLEP